MPSINPLVIALCAITSIHLLHMVNIRWGIIFQDTFTIIKVGLIIIFIIFGSLVQRPEITSVFPIAGDIKILFSPEFAVSLIWVSYAYTGWNSSIYVAGEIKNPKLNISKSMILATLFVTTLYLMLNYIFLFTTPIELMKGKVEIGYIAGVQIFGHFGGKIMSIGISIMLLSTLSSYIYIGPRIMQAMGEDHKMLGNLSTKTPTGFQLKHS